MDLETTGLDPESCEVLEIGAIAEDTSEPKIFAEIPKFHTYVVNPSGFIKGSPFALQMNAAILKRIVSLEEGFTYFEPKYAIFKLSAWLKNFNTSGSPNRYIVTIAGKNPAFDLGFLGKMSGVTRVPMQICDVEVRHRTIDPSSLYLDPKTDDKSPGLEDCLKRAGLTPTAHHTALGDAWDVIRLFRYKWGNHAL